MLILFDPDEAMPQALHCDLFCTVIDNYGDAGVCWRLARQLAREQHWHVRLFIDQPAVLAALQTAPLDHDRHAEHGLGHVTILPWPSGDSTPSCSDDVVHVVIEAFGCTLPEHVVAAMVGAAPPIWINLEYMSAEAWTTACHLQHSRHARLPLEKTFFFPGFRPGTGGLLREHDLDARRRAFLSDTAARQRFWRSIDIPAPTPSHLLITLFGYENAALANLLEQWTIRSADLPDIDLVVPQSRISQGVADFFGLPDFNAGGQAHRGGLHAYAMPFVDQDRYDALLWQADLNFVRGEDSFVRAQWAQRPAIWQIYPQDDDAHFDKLDAVHALQNPYLPVASAAALTRFSHAWNGRGTLDWADLERHLPALRERLPQWTAALIELGPLASNLAEFVKTRLK